jgi:hypothetical protein
MSLEPERERIVESLSAHYAEDHLTTQELEQRFERAYRAKTLTDLQAVLSGLPALTAPVRAPVPRPSARKVAVATPSPQGERRYFAMMSTFRRGGNWTPNKLTVVKAIMSEVRIDLRDATFVDSEIDIDITAVMADALILVPPGVRVECDGFSMMGEFTSRDDMGANDLDAPLVRVRGSAWMAKVSVETRMPGETRAQARKRYRLADDKD